MSASHQVARAEFRSAKLVGPAKPMSTLCARGANFVTPICDGVASRSEGGAENEATKQSNGGRRGLGVCLGVVRGRDRARPPSAYEPLPMPT